MFGSGTGIGWGAIERVIRLILEAPTRELFALNGEADGDTMLIAFGYLDGVISIRCIREMTWVFACVEHVNEQATIYIMVQKLVDIIDGYCLQCLILNRMVIQS